MCTYDIRENKNFSDEDLEMIIKVVCVNIKKLATDTYKNHKTINSHMRMYKTIITSLCNKDKTLDISKVNLFIYETMYCSSMPDEQFYINLKKDGEIFLNLIIKSSIDYYFSDMESHYRITTKEILMKIELIDFISYIDEITFDKIIDIYPVTYIKSKYGCFI
jgi:hypothetical protein